MNQRRGQQFAQASAERFAAALLQGGLYDVGAAQVVRTAGQRQLSNYPTLNTQHFMQIESWLLKITRTGDSKADLSVFTKTIRENSPDVCTDAVHRDRQLT